MNMWSCRTLLLGVVQLLHIALVTGESFHKNRNHSDQAVVVTHENEVKNRNDAEFILSKYGYLRCRVVSRRRREASSLSSPSASFLRFGARRVDQLSLEEGGGDYVCDEKEVKDAILEYQKTYNLPQTGRVDKRTKSLMSTSRCGNKDEDENKALEESAMVNMILDKVEPRTDESGHHPVMKDGDDEVDDNGDDDDDHVNDDDDDSSEHKNTRLWKRSTGSELSRLLKRNKRNPKTRGHEYLQRHLEDYIDQIKTEAKGKRRLLHRYTRSERRRRSVHVTAGNSFLPIGKYRDENGDVFNKKVIKWRLLNTGFSTRIPVEDQRATISLAFRMWSEVIPLRFIEDTSSDIYSVDIEIAFGKGSHQNCERDFDGNGGDIAHSWDAGNMHFDDAENFKSIRSFSPEGIYLLRVTVHEIGHVLGLVHTNKSESIMYAIYRGTQLAPTFELSKSDRKDIQKQYGVCTGRFDTVFDWVRKSPDQQFIYNTYFFRHNHYWMYENYANRTRYGDPLYIAREWRGVPNDIDGYVHIWLFNGNKVIDDIFFFKGDMYYKYNNTQDRVYDDWPRRIQDGFGPKKDSQYSIPDNIDSVFFDPRDKNLYFFKNDDVYVYDPIATGDKKGCCVRKAKILEIFPPAEGEDPLPGNLDAVYYSYRDKMMYFMKGENLWRNKLFDPRQRRIHNRIELLGPWHNKFSDICDVEVKTADTLSFR